MNRTRIILILTYCILTLTVLFFIAPVLFMFIGSLKPEGTILTEAGTWRALFPERVTLQNYRDALVRTAFLSNLVNSVIINALIVIPGLFVNSLAGYALARLRWRGRKTALVFILAVMIIPFEAIAVPLFYQVTTLGWRDSYSVQCVPFIAYPLSIYLFYSFFLGLPRELEESARIDGAGPFRTFFTIIAPNAKPAFGSVAIVTLLLFWGMYLWPLLVTAGEQVRPLPLGIATFYTLPPRQWGDILAYGVMMVSPMLIVFLAFQPWFVKGVATTGMK